jgi:hypothetical protein
MRLVLPATLLALCFAAAPALADSAPLVKTEPAQFPSAKAQIVKDLKDGKTYAELTRTQREEVLAALDRIEAILDGTAEVSELDDKDKVQLINDQEFVNTTLTQAAEDSRLVCKSVRKTGSHRLTPSCRTVAEIRRERESSQEALRSHYRVKMPVRE